MQVLPAPALLPPCPVSMTRQGPQDTPPLWTRCRFRIIKSGPTLSGHTSLWVIDMGLMACAGVILVAAICMPIRGILLYWRLIDCSFGVFGAIPLWLVRRYTLELSRADGGAT